jgi:site-specific recombinase XerD
VDAQGREHPDCTRFLERLSVRGLSVCTLEAYAYDLALAYRWMAAEDLQLPALTAEDAHRFLSWERGRASAPKSINRRLSTLRLLYRFLVGKELPGATEPRAGRRLHVRDRTLGLQSVALRPTRNLRVKEPRKLVEPLTREQVRQLLESLRRYRDMALAYVMLLCGLRSQEALSLRLSDVDFHDRRLRVRGKGGKERAVPLPLLLVDVLRRYLALERPKECASDRVFTVLQGKKRGQPMTGAALRRVFRTRRLNAVLANANPHRLRHTFGADMVRSGVRLPTLQRMMGHAYLDTTVQYANLTIGDVAEEFQRAVKVLEGRYGAGGRETP